MKAVCQNVLGDCDYDLYEKVFKVRSIEKGKCPNCGSSNIAPAWIVEFRLPGEEEARENIIKAKKEIRVVEERIKQLEKQKEALSG